MNRPLRADVLEVTSFLAALFGAAGPAPDAARRVTDALVEAISRAAVAVRWGFSMRRDGPLRAHGGGGRVPGAGDVQRQAHHGGAERLVGTNPVAIGFPVRGEARVVFNMGTTTGTIGATRQKLTAEQPLPDNWALPPRVAKALRARAVELGIPVPTTMET